MISESMTANFSSSSYRWDARVPTYNFRFKVSNLMRVTNGVLNEPDGKTSNCSNVFVKFLSSMTRESGEFSIK